MTIDGATQTSTASFTPGAQFSGGVSFNFENTAAGASSFSLSTPITVTTTASASVSARATQGDVVVEVPTSTMTCGYTPGCSPLILLPITLTNSNSVPGILRLTISRNFPARNTVKTSASQAEVRLFS